MKKKLFIVLIGVMFLAACSSKNKIKDDNITNTTTEEVQDANESTPEEAIDDTGEATADDTTTMTTGDSLIDPVVEQE